MSVYVFWSGIVIGGPSMMMSICAPRAATVRRVEVKWKFVRGVLTEIDRRMCMLNSV